MYFLLRHLLFRLSPEVSHTIVLTGLQWAHHLGLKFLFPKKIIRPITLMGLQFDNPVGLAAGLDKNGDYIDGLAMLGFGFLEIGTVTPRPQPGNPKPRLFRLTQDQAIINRMGFNNKGADYVLQRLQQTKYSGILGVNIGKNSDTPNEKAVDDYVYLFKKFAPYASYITINISSPNTKDLRALQQGDFLRNLLRSLKDVQQTFQVQLKKYVPLAVKIAPDLSDEDLKSICETLLAENVDAVIATNTTVTREGLTDEALAQEKGGLSGKPLTEMATQVIELIKIYTHGKIPIIGSGGVMSGADAANKQEQGASLIQVYTGLIYRGPEIISECCRMLK